MDDKHSRKGLNRWKILHLFQIYRAYSFVYKITRKTWLDKAISSPSQGSNPNWHPRFAASFGTLCKLMFVIGNLEESANTGCQVTHQTKKVYKIATIKRSQQLLLKLFDLVRKK